MFIVQAIFGGQSSAGCPIALARGAGRRGFQANCADWRSPYIDHTIPPRRDASKKTPQGKQ
jgi:hypothetical protein